ncbi:transducin beta-like protein 2 [Eucyclogobius newberryi]|uniref:transducin beta-like protein 2 n=1 Tax=Eucyclogobius newberryi TaxID=166745 RepID=UPI003B5CA899
MEVAALGALTLLLGALVLLVLLALGKRTDDTATTAGTAGETAGNGAVKSSAVKKQKQEKQQRRSKDKIAQHTFSHPLLAATLKAHNGNVTCLDFSSNGKYLASCADDRTVRIWSTKDFMEREHKCLRANVELDHAVLVRFSPDSRAFITWLANGDTIRIIKMAKKEDGTLSFKAAVEDFPQKHKASIINIGIAETGKFIMSASTDTTIHIWDLRGDILASLNTNQVTNSYATVSPCGRFVASCGFTPDVKVWEVCFGKGGEFREVIRAFDLKGHSAGVHALAFSNDSHRMATVSKDGTWKLWNTDVEYRKQQDPYLLKTVPCPSSEGSRVALSPDGRVLAVSDASDVYMYNCESGELEERLSSVHSTPLTDLRFDTTGLFLACSGDRAVRVLHNAPGHRAAIAHLGGLLKKAQSEAMRDRLTLQMEEAKRILDTLLSHTYTQQ